MGPGQTRADDNTKIFFEFRKAIREYVSAVNHTMKALHNRSGCTMESPCAYCRRRKNAETALLNLTGSEPKTPWLDEVTARLCAADTAKKM
jgi:hypothetical protein